MNKAVFFDIDGTLWDQNMTVPESTVHAIRTLRQNGDYAFICSGRSRSIIQADELLDIGFDGIIAGCGTHIEYQDQVIFEKTIPQEELNTIIPLLQKHAMSVVLEGPKYIYADLEALKDDFYIRYLRKILGDDLKPIQELNGQSVINKLDAVGSAAVQTDLVQALGRTCELIFHGETILEVMPKGFSKATGIQRVCEYLGISHEDTYAFGDSANDIEMLKYVKYGIAMGNAADITKHAADYVTAPLQDDGIWKGLKHFGLIESAEKED